MGRLSGKVALVTGGARGMGAAEARIFAEEGATVWIADVLDDVGDQTAGDIGATYRHLDVRNEADWENLVAEIVANDTKIDVLVNNAGIYRTGRLQETGLDDFQAMMAVNCNGVFLGMKSAGKAMIEAGAGSIVNISSVAGIVGVVDSFAYGASKWAVRGMTKSAALEYARFGVRVNSIHPGVIDTDMTRDMDDTRVDRMAKTIPARRVAQAEEVANMALFLASDESSYCTGSEFIVDGGMTA